MLESILILSKKVHKWAAAHNCLLQLQEWLKLLSVIQNIPSSSIIWKIISLASCSLHWSFNHVQARNCVFMQAAIRDKTWKLCLGSHKKKCMHTENSYTSDTFCTCTMFLSDIWRNILHLIHLWLYGYFQYFSARFNLIFHDVGSAVRWLHYVQLK